MYAESFPVDDLVQRQSSVITSLHIQVHPPLPGSGNQTRHNKLSRPLGYHTSVDTHLAAGHNGVILCDGDLNAP